jgi:cell division septum initiation protein DivIVA
MMDNPVEPASGGPYDPSLGTRVSHLEGEVQDLKSAVARVEQIVTRIEATLPHLATKAELVAGQADTKAELVAGQADTKAAVAETRAAVADTKVAVAELRAEMKGELGAIRVELAEKPGKTYMWGVLGVLLMAYACGLAALAVLK